MNCKSNRMAERRHKASGGCIGEGCEHESHSYAKGGEVETEGPGISNQGMAVRHAHNAKERMSQPGMWPSTIEMNAEHKTDSERNARQFAKNRQQREKDIKPKIQGLAEGGEVKRERPNSSKGQKGWVHEKDYSSGVHRETTGTGESYAGSLVRSGFSDRAKDVHKAKLEESKEINPKMQGLAEGGEVESMEGEDHESVNHELMEMCADELCEAIEKKDKKGIIDAIKALVMSCME